jgi:hypothetical protein
MNRKHRQTLQALFRSPTPAGLDWLELEALLCAVGCVIVEGSGSRVRFVFGQEVEIFHRPHPIKEAKRYQVRQARDFLTRIGVTP